MLPVLKPLELLDGPSLTRASWGLGRGWGAKSNSGSVQLKLSVVRSDEERNLPSEAEKLRGQGKRQALVRGAQEAAPEGATISTNSSRLHSC
jgi:hypothetical protein